MQVHLLKASLLATKWAKKKKNCRTVKGIEVQKVHFLGSKGPLFLDPASGLYHFESKSPIPHDANNAWSLTIYLDLQGFDINPPRLCNSQHRISSQCGGYLIKFPIFWPIIFHFSPTQTHNAILFFYCFIYTFWNVIHTLLHCISIKRGLSLSVVGLWWNVSLWHML